MHIGVTMRNMGPESTAPLMGACASAAERHGFESIWITDHMAIPPDDAEGSNGRYVDPLITLAWLAGMTARIKLGAGVLILPYRPALPTAKQLASLQELSGERLLLGVGVGWMDAEFRALGVDRHSRGRISDETLAFLNRYFNDDVVEQHDQPFLPSPQPAPAPVLVGGAAPHALVRAAKFGDGWLPMGIAPDTVAGFRAQYVALTEAAGKPRGTISVMTSVPLAEPDRARERIDAYRAAGVDRLIVALRYQALAAYEEQLDALTQVCR